MWRLLLSFVLMGAVSVASAQECRSNKPEKFDKFFSRFSKESGFAKSRTRYPLTVMVREPGAQAEEGTKSFLSEEDDFASPALSAFMQENDMMYRGAKLSRTAALVTLLRQEPAWRLVYRFALEDGCWYLRQVEDQFE